MLETWAWWRNAYMLYYHASSKENVDRRPGGIEPLSLSAPTGLKPAPNTSQAQFGIEPVTIRFRIAPCTM